MPRRLTQALALWFVLQVFLPFTAPLQACDLADILGTRSQHTAPISPESTSMPTTTETGVPHWFLSPIESSALRAFSDLTPPEGVVRALVVDQHALPPSPQVQRTVLRL